MRRSASGRHSAQTSPTKVVARCPSDRIDCRPTTQPTPQAWRTLVLLYPAANARWGSGLLRRRSQRVTSRPEREAIDGVLARVPAAVAGWSEGNAALDPFDLVVVRRPLSSLSSTGDGKWWAGPRDCRQEIDELNADGRYDSVIVLWPSDGAVWLCGWGCTIGPSDAVHGAGFTSIATDHWPTLATDPDPEQGYVHEWLHQVEAVYRGLGLGPGELPDLHAAGDYTSDRAASEPPFGKTFAQYHDGGARTWRPWYRDYMTGRLRAVAGGETGIGLTPERWALRRR